jgi:hypothetical protein
MGEARNRKRRLGPAYGTPEGSNRSRPYGTPEGSNRSRPADPVPFVDASGHTCVTLIRPDGTSETRRLADLVAATFLGPCPEDHHLVHGPGGITDNSLPNLSYRAIETPEAA